MATHSTLEYIAGRKVRFIRRPDGGVGCPLPTENNIVNDQGQRLTGYMVVATEERKLVAAIERILNGFDRATSVVCFGAIHSIAQETGATAVEFLATPDQQTP